MKINESNIQINETFVSLNPDKILIKILNHLDNGIGLSIVRIGDGEMILLNEVKDKISNFSIRQIGRKLNYEELLKVQENIKISICESDILGLPTKSHIQKNKLWADILVYYNKLKSINEKKWDNKEYCTIDIHLDLMKSKKIFELFSKIDKIVIVSSRDIQQKLIEKFPNLKYVEQYLIPGEQVYEIKKNKDIDIFKSIDFISEKLSSTKRDGQLLIYGAGPFGKHLGQNFSKMNGVALDLGSVFDFLVGKVTRGEGKGPESFIKPLL